MQLCGVHTMNLHEVSSTLYNIQQKAERAKGQIMELNNFLKSTQRETDRDNFKPSTGKISYHLEANRMLI